MAKQKYFYQPIKISFIVALAGILFGFDTIVISGIEQDLQSIWSSADLYHGLVVISSALWGTVIGALLGGYPTSLLGRKKTLMIIALIFFVSALGSALSNSSLSFAFFRFIGGLGIGTSTIAAPAYISEISPKKNRGKFVGLYQFCIVLGILLGLTSNYWIDLLIAADPWRWMLAVEALPALIFFILLFKIPQSPRWLLQKGKSKAALEISENLGIKQKAIFKESADQSAKRDGIYSKTYRKIFWLTFFIAFFNQFSGINAILYYAPRIFEAADMARSASLFGGVGIGVVNLCFTLIGMYLIDRYGRRLLLLIGSIGYILSLSLVALAFGFNWSGQLIMLFLFVFIAAHAIGQGTVIWVYLAEIYPNHLRAYGQAFGSSVHWILAATIPAFIPFLFSEIGAAFVFALFAAFMLLQLIWVINYVPETKGVELEELNQRLSANQ